MRSRDCLRVRSTAATSCVWPDVHICHVRHAVGQSRPINAGKLRQTHLGCAAGKELLDFGGHRVGGKVFRGGADDARDEEGAVEPLVERGPVGADVGPERVTALRRCSVTERDRRVRCAVVQKRQGRGQKPGPWGWRSARRPGTGHPACGPPPSRCTEALEGETPAGCVSW